MFFKQPKTLAELINEMQWPVPLDVFFALASKTVFPTVDLAIINTRDGEPKIQLNKRPPSDPFFAGLWHIPGAVIIPGDTALSTLMKRVLKEDVGIRLSHDPEFVFARDILKGPSGPNTSPRGQEAYRLFQYVLEKDDPMPADGIDRMWCSLSSLPKAFIKHQMPSIERLRALHGV